MNSRIHDTAGDENTHTLIDKKEETRQTYNRGAAGMAKKFERVGSRIEHIERAFSYVREDDPKVLEIGCGNGRDAKEILNFTNDYLGIDISEGMIELARQNFPEAKEKFLVADVETCVFPQQIDVIFAFAALLHLDKNSVKHVLRKAHAHLAKDGIFCISVKHDTYHEKIKNDEFGTRVFYFYTEEDFRQLAKETGYEIVHEQRSLLLGVDWLIVMLRNI